MSDKTKDFQEFIKQDFDVVEDYKASKDLTPKDELHKIFENITGVQSVTAYDKSVANIEKALSQHEALVKGVQSLVEKYDAYIEQKEGVLPFGVEYTDEDFENERLRFIKDLKQLLEEDKDGTR